MDRHETRHCLKEGREASLESHPFEGSNNAPPPRLEWLLIEITRSCQREDVDLGPLQKPTDWGAQLTDASRKESAKNIGVKLNT
eukprot:scaffold2318_cov363-Pavlova_lutheri.AAC.16